MKKLGKNLKLSKETVEAYSTGGCACWCSCNCYGNGTASYYVSTGTSNSYYSRSGLKK